MKRRMFRRFDAILIVISFIRHIIYIIYIEIQVSDLRVKLCKQGINLAIAARFLQIFVHTI